GATSSPTWLLKRNPPAPVLAGLNMRTGTFSTRCSSIPSASLHAAVAGALGHEPMAGEEVTLARLRLGEHLQLRDHLRERAAAVVEVRRAVPPEHHPLLVAERLVERHGRGEPLRVVLLQPQPLGRAAEGAPAARALRRAVPPRLQPPEA